MWDCLTILHAHSEPSKWPPLTNPAFSSHHYTESHNEREVTSYVLSASALSGSGILFSVFVCIFQISHMLLQFAFAFVSEFVGPYRSLYP